MLLRHGSFHRRGRECLIRNRILIENKEQENIKQVFTHPGGVSYFKEGAFYAGFGVITYKRSSVLIGSEDSLMRFLTQPSEILVSHVVQYRIHSEDEKQANKKDRLMLTIAERNPGGVIPNLL